MAAHGLKGCARVYSIPDGAKYIVVQKYPFDVEEPFELRLARAVRVVERARSMRTEDDAVSNRHVEKPMGEAIQIVVANATAGGPYDNGIVCSGPELDYSVLEGGCIDAELLATLPIRAAIREELKDDIAKAQRQPVEDFGADKGGFGTSAGERTS